MLRLFAALCLTSGLSAQTITIAPAPVDRAALVVRAKVAQAIGDVISAKDSSGHEYALQAEDDQTSTFVVGFIPANATTTLKVAKLASAKPPAVKVGPGEDGLMISINGKEALNFRTNKDKKPRADIKPDILRAGYLHPVRSPSGAVVTEDYPSDHVHHHGIWTPYTKASFQGRATDFWNMHLKKGEEQLHAVGRQWSGEVHGGFEAELHMNDLSGSTPITALYDRWSVKAYVVSHAPKAIQVFDLTTTQTCATDSPLELPEYHYGSFGLRGPDAWNGVDGARFLTSEGITDRKKGEGTRARWCYLGGKTEAGLSGTAVLGFPENFRFPTPLRLHPNMPYFSIVPQKLGAFTIEPGKPYVTRYRFVVTDGEPDANLFEACWNSLAYPAVSSVAR